MQISKKIVILVAIFAYGTSADSKEEYSLATSRMDEIEVTGYSNGNYSVDRASINRNDSSLFETPQSIQVLNSILLREQELTNLSDALLNVSSVVPNDPAEAVLANPIIRGFEAEIFVDGLIAYGDTAVIDPSSLIGIEQIEVAKGPTSVLFGGGTGAPVGGLINVVSKKPKRKAFTTIGLRTGSFSRLVPYLDLNRPLSDDIGFRIAAEIYHSNDFINEVDIERITLNPSLDINFSTNSSFLLQGHYNKIEQLEYPGLPASVANIRDVDPLQFPAAPDAPRTEIENKMVTMNLDHHFGSNLLFNVRFRKFSSEFQEFSSFGFFSVYPVKGSLVTLISGQLATEVNETTIDSSVSFGRTLFGADHRFLVGVTYDSTKYEAATGFDFSPIGVLDLASSLNNVSFGAIPTFTENAFNDYRTKAVYFQDQISFLDSINLVIGGRYSEYELTEQVGTRATSQIVTKFDPRIGLNVEILDGIALYAGWSTGSRLSPFFAGENGNQSNPETSRNVETGIKLAFGKYGLTATLASFWTTRENVPSASLTIPFASVQTGKQQSEGFEIDIVFEPNQSFSILGNFSHVDARVSKDTILSEGEFLARIPRNSGRIAGRYRFQNGFFSGIGIGAGVTFADEAELTLPNTISSDSYFVADFQTDYVWKQFRFALSVVNLFDNNYFRPFQYLNQPVVRPGQPLAAFTNLTVTF